MQRGKFLLSGNASYRNRGCEGIVRGTVEILDRQFGESWYISNYFCPPGCKDAQDETDDHIIHRPFPALTKYSLPWWENRFSWKFLGRPGRRNSESVERTVKRLLATEPIVAALMVGGDNYSFDYGPPDRFFRINEIILEEGIPSIIWGASIGPFTQDPAYERQAASALKNVTLITARETETISYLDSIGVKDNVFHTADPALHLGPSPCTIPDELEALLTQGCIGLNLSPLLQKYFLAHEDPFEAWINTAAKIVDCLTRQVDLPVVLIPHVLYEFTSRSEYANNDWLLLSRVAEIVNKPEQVYLMGPHYNAAQSKWIISRLRLFAGARTHATIAAMSSNVPTICIGYSMKARGIAQDTYGNLRWLIDGQDCVTDVSLLADHMVDLIHQESAVRAHLEAANPLLKERAGAAAGALALALDDV